MAIGEEVWGDCDGSNVTSNRFGKGQVFSGISPAGALKIMQIAPQIKFPAHDPEIAWIQRHMENTDLYFLSNQSDRVIHTEAAFRSLGKKPEFWDAVQGQIRDVHGWTVEGEHTRVPLDLMPGESVFIVFRYPGKPGRDPYVSVELPSGNNKDSLWYPGIETAKGLQLRAWENGKHIVQHAQTYWKGPGGFNFRRGGEHREKYNSKIWYPGIIILILVSGFFREPQSIRPCLMCRKAI
jgi:hypothetical protein